MRLFWQVRKEIADREGVATIVNVMKRWTGSGGVQCNGCLAIVSLVRSESEICQVSCIQPSCLTPLLRRLAQSFTKLLS